MVGAVALSLIRENRTARTVSLISAALLVVVLVDAGMNAGRAYPGVRVGEIDVSGKTAEEIALEVHQTYDPRVAQGAVTVYANDEAAWGKAQASEGTAPAEQLTAQEERAATTSWATDASSLAAEVPAAKLAEHALSVGRGEDGLLARLSALVSGRTVDVSVDYGRDQLESLASVIDAAIGEPRVDYGIAVFDGVATVTEGQDGDLVSRASLARSLDNAFLSKSDGQRSFVAHVEHAPVRIGPEEAQSACDDVNFAIGDGARFIHGEAEWDVGAAEIGSWVNARIEERGDVFALVPFIDGSKAKPDVVSFAKDHADSGALCVSYDISDSGIMVHAEGPAEIPLAADTVASLDDALFGPEGKAATGHKGIWDGSMPESRGVEVDVATGPLPERLGFEEALELGVIEPLSSFTTEFTTGQGTDNRNHNIALVSQLLTDSTVGPGERWSFNETAGECNADRGFLGAGAIVDGVYDDAVGGGICQVATTVFNAVYESGFPVATRHNHSLYIANYPAGRDAAVSWPDLDLVWENDSESAVLVRVTCANSSVTATLYGTSPGYQTGTKVGTWQTGEKHGIKTERDNSLAPDVRSVKTRGTDGSTISVVRTVRNKAGEVLHEDLFVSEYDPVTEVVVTGPDASSERDTAPDGSGGNGT